jgi:acetyltransferase-like isoleucine patch superfamily enzyme
MVKIMWRYPKIKDGKLTKWNWMVQHKDKLHLGKNTDLGAFCYLNAKHGIWVGNNVQIGSHCSIYTTSSIDNKHGCVAIGDNVKIGTHSTIMPNVIIGKGAIIGAYSFVKNDIPANRLAYGIPAKVKNVSR